MKNRKTWLVLVISGVIILMGLSYWFGRAQKQTSINSFEECVAAGFGIMESDPPQCMVPGGKSFTQKVDQSQKKPEDIAKECRVVNCHGLEVECGSELMEKCTYIYQLGDQCREYVSCQVKDGICSAIYQDEFHQCESCVDDCLEKFSEDSVKLNQCEAECG